LRAFDDRGIADLDRVDVVVEPEEAAQLERLRAEKEFASDRDAIAWAIAMGLRRR
jgi:hypothetical protein